MNRFFFHQYYLRHIFLKPRKYLFSDGCVNALHSFFELFMDLYLIFAQVVIHYGVGYNPKFACEGFMEPIILVKEFIGSFPTYLQKSWFVTPSAIDGVDKTVFSRFNRSCWCNICCICQASTKSSMQSFNCIQSLQEKV